MPNPSQDNFLTFEAVISNIATLLFPLAGVIPRLKAFYLDESSRQIVTTFAFIFSYATVLYCRSQGVELVYKLSWHWGLIIAFLLWVAYLALLELLKRKLVSWKAGAQIFWTVFSSILFVGFFLALSYGFNNLGLMKFSHFRVHGRVYTQNETGAYTASNKIPVEIVLTGKNDFRAASLADDQGRYEFDVNLSDLYELTEVVASDPAGRFKSATCVPQPRISGNLQCNFFMQRKSQ